jgi:osmotically-inducible protein OsmY
MGHKWEGTIMNSDTQIQQAVLRELAWDTRVITAHIGVTVERGVVTLSGTVPTYAERLAAQDAAHRVAGVLDVANDLQVLPPGQLVRSDTAIAQAVRHALEWDVLVPESHIQTTISEGWVILEGSVDFWHQREDAERAVRHLAGVRGVTNHIVVSVPEVAASEIQAEIEEALERRAERAAKRIAVTIHDGTVTLTGTVHSLAEKRAVVGAARATHGVRALRDQVTIDLIT